MHKQSRAMSWLECIVPLADCCRVHSRRMQTPILEFGLSRDIPIIETARLILRDHRLADFDIYVAMWADPLVTRFIGGRARSREESWIRFLRHAGMWRHVGFGFWAIEEKESGRFVG